MCQACMMHGVCALPGELNKWVHVCWWQAAQKASMPRAVRMGLRQVRSHSVAPLYAAMDDCVEIICPCCDEDYGVFSLSNILLSPHAFGPLPVRSPDLAGVALQCLLQESSIRPLLDLHNRVTGVLRRRSMGSNGLMPWSGYWSTS